MSVRISVIDPRQAIECGMTPSQLRATANSLERIARRGYGRKQPAYDRRQAYDTARKLRHVAREVESKTRGGKNV